ncbi:MAG: two-component regulator propeller domain-containing protein [Chloroflexota bacterium]
MPDKDCFVKKYIFAFCAVLQMLLLFGCRDPRNIAVTPAYTNTPHQTPTTIPIPTVSPIKANFTPGWTTFTNANEWISDLAFDNDGHLWVASQGGLVKWDIVSSTYQKYTTANGLPSNRIDAVFLAKDGTLWIGASGGIISFDGNEWKTHRGSEGQSSGTKILQDHQGKLWFVGSGATTYDGEIWKTYTMDDGMGANAVASIAEDAEGNIWLGTWFLYCGCEGSPEYTEGISRFNGQKWDVLGKEIGLDDKDPSSSIRVNAIAFDNKGGVWFGTSGFGAIYYDGSKATTYTMSDGLSDNTIMDIHVGEDGIIWFGTWNGVTMYNGEEWKSFSTFDGLTGNVIFSIAMAPDHSMWFGTSYGILSFDGKEWHPYITDDKLPSTYVTDIDSTEQGTVWLGTTKGVVYTDGNKWQILDEDDGLPANQVEIVRIAPDKTLWIGTENGLAHLVDGDWTVYHEGRFDHELYDLAFDDFGGLWVGTYGAYYFDGDKWTGYIAEGNYWVVNSNKLTYSTISGIWTGGWGVLSNFDGNTWVSYGRGEKAGWDIRALATAPNGSVWVASDISDATFHTETGFKSFNGSKWNLETKLDLRDVTDMDFASNGMLWVATRDGAYMYDGTKWTHYTIEDGLAGNEITTIHVAGDGAIWFATHDGLTRFGQ